MNFPCVVGRDLARYQAEVDDESAYDDALEKLMQGELFDAIEAMDIDPALCDLISEILGSDDTVTDYFKIRMTQIAEQSAIDAAEARADW